MPLFWGAGLTAFVFGFESPFGVLRLTSVQLAILAALSLTPIGVALFAAYVVRQGSRLEREVRRTRSLAEDMTGPALLASVAAGRAAADVAAQVEAVRDIAAAVRRELGGLRAFLTAEGEELAARSGEALHSAERLRETMSAEREGFERVIGRLDGQAASMADAIASQARMVADASDLAQAQVGEAEAALAARAADLRTAASTAAEAGRAAADDLARQALRLEKAGERVGDQMREVEAALNSRRLTLEEAAEGLREAQDRLSVQAEADQARFAVRLEQVANDVRELSGQTSAGADKLTALLADASGHVRRLAADAEARRSELDAAAEAGLDRLALSVAQHRRALEAETTDAAAVMTRGAAEALTAAGQHAASARSEIEALRASVAEADEVARDSLDERIDAARRVHDQLAEMAFTASSLAAETFEGRLADARRLIEQASILMDDASQRTAARIDAGLSASTASLSALHAGLDQIDQRLAQLPDEADARATAISDVLERATADLVASARRAALETQAIDAAFQDRIRSNYQMLSQAVRLMGAVADPESAPDARSPQTPRSEPRPEPELVREAAEPPPGLRPRLRLTPAPAAASLASVAETISEPDFQAVFAAAGGPIDVEKLETEPRSEDGWTWKELLTSMDEAPMDDDVLAEHLLAEVDAMGVDAATALPKARVGEIAAAWVSGDGEGVRMTVVRSAPSAVRRLSRRIATDQVLAGQVARFVTRYRGSLSQARRDDRSGTAIAALFGSAAGRAYLLLDAAVAEAEGV